MFLHRSRRLTVFCGLMSVALFASAAVAQQRSRRSTTPGGYAEGRMMKNKAEEIGLSEESLAKIDAAMEAEAVKEEALREQTAAAIEELNEILLQNLPDEAELLAAAKKVGETAAKSRELKMKSVIEMRSLLTAEQLEKFMEIRNKAIARR